MIYDISVMIQLSLLTLNQKGVTDVMVFCGDMMPCSDPRPTYKTNM